MYPQPMDAATTIVLALATTLYALMLFIPRRPPPAAAAPRAPIPPELQGETMPMAFKGSELAFALYTHLRRLPDCQPNFDSDNQGYLLALEGSRLNIAQPLSDADLHVLSVAIVDAARGLPMPLHVSALAEALHRRGLPPVDPDLLESAAALIESYVARRR
jgi:hypothetical protein